MRFFDFHSHPVLKQLFNDNPNIDSLIYRSDVAALPALCSDLPTIIESQTHQSQLADFQDEVIIGAALYSVESYVAKAVIPLRKYLKQNSQFKLSQKVLEDAKMLLYVCNRRAEEKINCSKESSNAGNTSIIPA